MDIFYSGINSRISDANIYSRSQSTLSKEQIYNLETQCLMLLGQLNGTLCRAINTSCNVLYTHFIDSFIHSFILETYIALDP